jgi:hypothetical protein
MLGERWSRQHEAVLKTGRALVDGKVFARFVGDRNGDLRNPFLIHQLPQQLAERAARRINGGDVGAEPFHHTRDIDAAAARIAPAF